MRWFIVGMLAAAMLPAAEMEVSAGRGVNIRKTPSTKSAVVGSLKSGERVQVKQVKDGWAELGGRNGYVSANYLKNAQNPPGPGEAKPEAKPDRRPAGASNQPSPARAPETRSAAGPDRPAAKPQTAPRTPDRPAAPDPRKPEHHAAPAPQPAPHGPEHHAAPPHDPPAPQPHHHAPPKPVFADLPVEPGSARDVTVTGLLHPVRSSSTHIRYALLTVAGDNYKTECFIYVPRPDVEKFQPFARQNVRLVGTWYKVPDWKKPVMKVRRIRGL